MMRIEWRDSTHLTFPVSVEVEAYDRFGLLHDITRALMLENANVKSISTGTVSKKNRVGLKMVLKVAELNRLFQVLEKIERIPNVLFSKRTIGPIG